MTTPYSGKPGNETRQSAVNISSSTNATPIVVTTAASHGLYEGDRVEIVSHATNTAANGVWYVHVVDATHISLYAAWTAGAVATASVGVGVGGATGTVQYLGLTPRVTLPDDGDLRSASSINVPNEDAKDGQAWLAERIGNWRTVWLYNVTKQAAAPATSVCSFTTSSGAWAVDTGIEAAWTVKPSVSVDVNDYVEIDLTSTYNSASANDIALAIGFVFLEHGAAYSSAGAVVQEGWQVFTVPGHGGIHIKARAYLSTALSGITHGMKLYPVLMSYGIGGTPAYSLLGDVSMTIKVWRPNV